MVEENQNIDNNEIVIGSWIDSYNTISKMWQDSYYKIYRPWLESAIELFEKAAEISTDATPEKYKEFYDAWTKIYNDRSYKIQEINNKDTLNKLLDSAEESDKIFRSWISELEEVTKNTRDALNAEPDPIKYKEIYGSWTDLYGKIFDELLSLPIRQNIKETFEKYTGLPDIYSDTFIEISKLWKESYTKFYRPWSDSIIELTEKSTEISQKNPGYDAYKEFYNIWIKTYKEIYGNSATKDTFQKFAESTNIYVDLYKSWINILETLSNKCKELSETESENNKDIYNLWAKTYEKSINSFFDNMPVVGPFRNVFEPVKNAAKIYADIFIKMSDIWIQSCARTNRMVKISAI